MSIMHCEYCDVMYDSDFVDHECPVGYEMTIDALAAERRAHEPYRMTAAQRQDIIDAGRGHLLLEHWTNLER